MNLFSFYYSIYRRKNEIYIGGKNAKKIKRNKLKPWLDKKLIEYINPIANQKAIKLKRRFYKTRQQSVVFLDDVQYGNTAHNDSNEVALIDSIQDSRYRYLDFMEECLSRIPEDHVFYVDDVRFNTKEIFRLLFSNYSGEEISDAAGVDGKRFRKVKRQLK